MKPMEHYTPDGTPINLAQRGVSGPLFITQEPPINNDPFIMAVQRGLSTSTGFPTNAPFVSDLNDPSLGDVGIGSNQDWVTPYWNTAQSIRSFAGNAFLTGTPSEGIPAIVDDEGFGLDGRKLRIVSNAQVYRIDFDSHNVARCVEFILTSDDCTEVRTAKVNKKVILSAGTIADAAILQRSGVGDSNLLSSLDIPVVYDNPNVGANVQNHYGPQAIIIGPTQPLLLNPLQIGSGFIDLGLFPAGVRRYQLFILGIPGGVLIGGINLVPKSLGTIKIVSKDPFFDPLINFNQYSDGGPSTPFSDAALAVQFLGVDVPAIVAQTGGTIVNYNPFGTPAELFAAAVSNNILTYHASGSARMASSPSEGVIDSNLHVFGVKKVMVASSSSAPFIEDGNTAYQSFVIGLEAAAILGANIDL